MPLKKISVILALVAGIAFLGVIALMLQPSGQTTAATLKEEFMELTNAKSATPDGLKLGECMYETAYADLGEGFIRDWMKVMKAKQAGQPEPEGTSALALRLFPLMMKCKPDTP